MVYFCTMSLERNSNAFLSRIVEILRGNPRTRFVFPNSPHFQQYYTKEFFDAIDPISGEQLLASLHDYIARIQNPTVEVHQTTDFPAVVQTRKGRIQVSTSGAATIARDHLLDPDLDKLRRTILITSIDQLLASFFGKNQFREVHFGSNRIKRNKMLESIIGNLTTLQEGDSFIIKAKDRTVEVKILPLPKAENFPQPTFCLIGPSGIDFKGTLDNARKSSKRVLFEMKRNQLELGLAYLSKYDPSSIIISGVSLTHEYSISENYQTRTTDKLPPVKKGNLELLIHAREGNVDSLVGSIKRSSKSKDIVGVFGVDVVQTGNTLRENNLSLIEQILPIPCYPVQLKVR